MQAVEPEVKMQENENTTLSRRERERERHRTEILEAAEEVFSQKGIAGATVEDVAARAEFAVGTIYNFFAGKDDLIRQVFMRLIKLQTTRIEQYVIPCLDDPLKALERLAETWMKTHSKHARLIRAGIMLRISLGKGPGDPPDDQEIAALLREHDKVMISIFEAGSKAGVYHKLNPRHLAIIFDGICKSFCVYWEQIRDTRPVEVRGKEYYAAIQAAITGRVPGKDQK